MTHRVKVLNLETRGRENERFQQFQTNQTWKGRLGLPRRKARPGGCYLSPNDKIERNRLVPPHPDVPEMRRTRGLRLRLRRGGTVSEI